MAFTPVDWPAARRAPAERRFADLLGAPAAEADIHMAGIPFDGAVIGRKGCRAGPAGIREAFRYIGGHDPQDGQSLLARICDHGDVAGLDESDVLATHATVRSALGQVFAAGRPVVLLGGDNSLTYPNVAALADSVGAGPRSIGIVVIDAHYDLRSYEGQPTSGTPFRRILEELDGVVSPQNLVEIGIRPYANATGLAEYAKQQGVRVHPMHAVRRDGIEAVTEAALETAADGVEHLWLSIDIDGLDQSIASGCSAPGAGGLSWHEAEHVVRTVSSHPLCRGMDLMEVAPELDPTGNTCRTAAQLVATFCGGVTGR